jgi:hypothetical protein
MIIKLFWRVNGNAFIFFNNKIIAITGYYIGRFGFKC